MSKPIDLGVSRSDLYPQPVSVSPAQPEGKSYPDTFIEGVEGLEFPESGTVTFKFEKVREVEEKRDGKKRCSYNLKLLEVQKIVPDAEAEDEEDDGEYSDETAAEAMDRKLKPKAGK